MRDPDGSTGVQVRVVGEGCVGGPARTEAARHELDEALEVIEIGVPRWAIPGRRLGGAGQRDAEAPPLVRAILVERAIPLADLEHGDVRAALSAVRGHDLQDAAEAGSGA